MNSPRWSPIPSMVIARSSVVTTSIVATPRVTHNATRARTVRLARKPVQLNVHIERAAYSATLLALPAARLVCGIVHTKDSVTCLAESLVIACLATTDARSHCPVDIDALQSVARFVLLESSVSNARTLKL